ncbi:hypothetical protein CVT24_001170 [Panaeolus cyanescens]|uniref:Uncharacterized protein n=1 Tax=Panaeolus cyanescens TaxID=181874 RepID=A0A409X0R6_9AGAR|nr:hypothetical protein CVT24_001170 [Panaeolus cyanescens]
MRRTNTKTSSKRQPRKPSLVGSSRKTARGSGYEMGGGRALPRDEPVEPMSRRLRTVIKARPGCEGIIRRTVEGRKKKAADLNGEPAQVLTESAPAHTLLIQQRTKRQPSEIPRTPHSNSGSNVDDSELELASSQQVQPPLLLLPSRGSTGPTGHPNTSSVVNPDSIPDTVDTANPSGTHVAPLSPPITPVRRQDRKGPKTECNVRLGNTWNAYQKKYAKSNSQEISSPPQAEADHPAAENTPKGRQPALLAFNQFKDTYGDHYREVLEIEREIDLIETTSKMTQKQRNKLFEQFFMKRIARIMDVASEHGFHSSIEACSAISNPDDGLHFSHQTSVAQNFYEEMFQVESAVVSRQFRAYVGYQAAKSMAPSSNNVDLGASAPTPDITTHGTQSGDSEPAANPRSVAIRQGILDLLEMAAKSKADKLQCLKAGNSQKLNWKALPGILANLRHTIINWPLEVALPVKNGSNKGLANISSTGQNALCRAFTDFTHPLKVVPWEKDAIEKDTPVMCTYSRDSSQPTIYLYSTGDCVSKPAIQTTAGCIATEGIGGSSTTPAEQPITGAIKRKKSHDIKTGGAKRKKSQDNSKASRRDLDHAVDQA